MGRRIDFGEIVARRKCAPLPENWAVYQWEVVGKDGIIYRGATFELFKSGPRKGERKWLHSKNPDWECVVTKDEMQSERDKFEKETGKCADCNGDGQEWVGWNFETGDKYATCRKCTGTGVAA